MSTPTPEDFEERLRLFATRLDTNDLKPFLPVVQALALTDQRRRFSTGTAPDGSKWLPLGHPRPNGGGLPLRDFGALGASVVARTEPNAVIVGTNLIYAGVHQWGATITPKSGKFLSIPLTVEAKRWGSPRFPRPFPRPLFPLFRKGANRGVLAEFVSGRLVAQYALVRSVVIPARPFLGYSPQFISELGDLWSEVLARKIQNGFEGK